VDRSAVLELLARADGSAELPRMGGMARADGVVIASADHWAFAARDGSVREGTMPQPPESLRRVPLVRGLIRLFSALAPLFRGAGVAGRGERLLLVAALLAPLSLIVLPQSASLPLGIGTAVVLLAWMLRGRTLFLHGAEHRAIAAAEERSLVATWNAETKPSRFAPRCGTNFAALVVPVSLVFDRFWPVAPAALAGADDGALADRADLALEGCARLSRPRPRAAAPDDARALGRGDTARADRRCGGSTA
jgi:uncharacterized protein DUF1385